MNRKQQFSQIIIDNQCSFIPSISKASFINKGDALHYGENYFTKPILLKEVEELEGEEGKLVYYNNKLYFKNREIWNCLFNETQWKYDLKNRVAYLPNFKVGFGTTNPTKVLDVKGDSLINGRLNITDTLYCPSIVLGHSNKKFDGNIRYNNGIEYYNKNKWNKLIDIDEINNFIKTDFKELIIEDEKPNLSIFLKSLTKTGLISWDENTEAFHFLQDDKGLSNTNIHCKNISADNFILTKSFLPKNKNDIVTKEYVDNVSKGINVIGEIDFLIEHQNKNTCKIKDNKVQYEFYEYHEETQFYKNGMKIALYKVEDDKSLIICLENINGMIIEGNIINVEKKERGCLTVMNGSKWCGSILFIQEWLNKYIRFTSMSNSQKLEFSKGIKQVNNQVYLNIDNNVFQLVDNELTLSIKNSGCFADGLITGEKISYNSLSSHHLQSSIINSQHINFNSILENHIKEEQINTKHLLNGSITSDKLGSKSVLGENIGDKVLEGYHIRDMTITGDKLEEKIIYNHHLTPQCITTENIGIEEVTSDNLASMSIKNSHISFSCIKSENISVNTIKEPHICDKIISTRVLQEDIIEKRHLKRGIIGVEEISDGSITVDKLNEKFILGDKHLERGFLKSEHLKEGLIKTEHLDRGIISKEHLQQGIIGSEEIMDSSINSNHINNASVLGKHIKNGNINEYHLANGVITTSKIFSYAITGDKISEGSIINKHLGTNSITNDKLATPYIKLELDKHFEGVQMAQLGNKLKIKLNDEFYIPEIKENITEFSYPIKSKELIVEKANIKSIENDDFTNILNRIDELKDLEKVLNKLGERIFGSVPIGSIIEYYGEKDNLTKGWEICEGQDIHITKYPQFFTINNIVGDTYTLPFYEGKIKKIMKMTTS